MARLLARLPDPGRGHGPKLEVRRHIFMSMFMFIFIPAFSELQCFWSIARNAEDMTMSYVADSTWNSNIRLSASDSDDECPEQRPFVCVLVVLARSRSGGGEFSGSSSRH